MGEFLANIFDFVSLKRLSRSGDEAMAAIKESEETETDIRPS